MPDLTDPRIVKLANERIRPLCERARALKAEIDSLSTDWFGGLNLLVPNDSSLLADGRDLDGISRLTGADITNAIGQLQGAAAAMNPEIIAKPCVQPLKAS